TATIWAHVSYTVHVIDAQGGAGSRRRRTERFRERGTLGATKIRSVEGGSYPRGNEDQIGRARVAPSRQRRSVRSGEGHTLAATKITSVEGGSDPRDDEDHIGRGWVRP